MPAINFIQSLNPTYASLSNINDYIAIATVNTGGFDEQQIGTLGTKKEYAIALRAMHLIALDQGVGDSGEHAGVIVSEREGELSRSYSVPEDLMKKYPDLCTTHWGMRLIELIKTNIFGPRTSSIAGLL